MFCPGCIAVPTATFLGLGGWLTTGWIIVGVICSILFSVLAWWWFFKRDGGCKECVSKDDK